MGMNLAEAVAREYETAVLSARRLALSGSAAGRLASVLLEWGRRSADVEWSLGMATEKNDEVALRFRMPLTHEELGTMARISCETDNPSFDKAEG